MSIRSACLVIIAGAFLGMFEATLSTFLQGLFAFILPVIPFVVLLVVRDRPSHALLAAGSAGLVMDIFTPEHPSFAIARLLMIALLVAFLARTVLTNQSLYAAVALTFIARTIDRSWLAVASWVHGSLSIFQVLRLSWPAAWRIALTDAVIVGIAFLLLTFFARRFVVGRVPTRTYV